MASLPRLLGSRTAGAVLLLGALNAYWEANRPRRTIIQERDAYLGWRMVPSQHHHDRFLKIPEDINSFGFRGREWSLAKPPGTSRIAVLGSSMTYGSSVPIEKIYPTILEERLVAAGVKAEVLDCAVQNYKLEQSVRSYETQVSRLSPDIVIQAFADQDVDPMDPARDPPRGDLRPWLTRTEFYRLFQWEWQPWVRRWAPDDPKPSWVKRDTTSAIHERLLVEPFAPELMPLWQAAESTMQRLYDDVRARGGKLVITVLPQPPQAMDPRFVGPEFVWSRFCKAREGCLYVDVITPLREAVAPFRARLANTNDPNLYGKLVYNQGNDPEHIYLGDVGGHFNEKGMRIIGEALARGIEPLLQK